MVYIVISTGKLKAVVLVHVHEESEANPNQSEEEVSMLRTSIIRRVWERDSQHIVRQMLNDKMKSEGTIGNVFGYPHTAFAVRTGLNWLSSSEPARNVNSPWRR